MEGVSEVNLKETPSIVLARRKTAAYRDNHVSDTRCDGRRLRTIGHLRIGSRASS